MDKERNVFTGGIASKGAEKLATLHSKETIIPLDKAKEIKTPLGELFNKLLNEKVTVKRKELVVEGELTDGSTMQYRFQVEKTYENDQEVKYKIIEQEDGTLGKLLNIGK